MRILMTGSTGLVGKALASSLLASNHVVTRLLRSATKARQGDVVWDPATEKTDPQALEGYDAVIHLAGENIAARRWSTAQKALIRSSRVQGTRFLCQTVAGLKHPPRILACASATGYYGDRGGSVLREDSGPGTGFLPGVCREWEDACKTAADRGLRVAHLRFGIVLSREGGALARMLLPFRLGLGAVLGNGGQYMSWITLDDCVAAVRYVLDADGLNGAVNVVSPGPVSNFEFTKTLGRVLRRPTPFPAPALALRLLLGEMADALLLSSTRAEPARLLAGGFRFRHPDLEEALQYILGETA